MDNLLEDGEILAARSGKRYEVIRKLGGGGQGEVYEVEGCGSETRFALKWYFRKFSTDKQESIVENLIQLGSPDPAFLWPGDIIYSDNASFGYVMPLRPRNFAGIADLMKRRAEPSFAILCRAAFNLARGYEKLHEMGLAYGDISFGNLFF
jgi:DNA-binding helix-hairpin-helix protein with protein kinase domain